jgi:quinoprotein glucose dehydrogenase
MRSSLLRYLTALAVALFGLFLGIGGAWLAVIGGSIYYLAAGILLLAVAWLLYRARGEALWLYALLLVGTLIWALAEADLDFWRLVPRGDVLFVLGLWLLVPAVSRDLVPVRRMGARALSAVLAVAVVVLVLALAKTHDLEGSLPPLAAAAPHQDPPDADWTAYGGTGAGQRYSPLTQINAGNVGGLKLAWEFRTGDRKGPDDPGEFTNEATPLKVGGLLYTCSPHQILFALDAATGRLRWKFDPKLKYDTGFQHMTCRGVSYHRTPMGGTTLDGQPAPQECQGRIFLPTNDGRLFALDAETGQPCEGFGDHGVLDLRQNNQVTTLGFYEGTSPPAVTEKVLIVGGAVIDNWSNKVPSGVIRGFDIYSGRLLWVFDAGNPDPNEMPSPSHDFSEGSPNSWAVSAVDEKLGLAYVPLGSSSPDIWGGKRPADYERWDSALVAIDIATGKLRWSFQNVHHDLWDMDMPSQPSLVDVETARGVVPAIYIPAKTGNIFVLDRRTGQPIVPVTERPVPQGPAPGDRLSPTQPFSDLRFTPSAKLSEKDMWGATPFDQLACRILFRRLRYEGPFTPPSLQGTLVFPGDFGMFEWGGLAVDPDRQIAIANPMSIPFVSRLIPRGDENPSKPTGRHPAGTELGVAPMFGTPFGVSLGAFLSPVGIPCLAPPWGEIAGVDLRTNSVVWKHPIGTIRDMAPVPVPLKLGVPMLGGPLVTAGGVAFLTGTMDYYIRAFDVTSGRLLWQDRLPAGGQSTPMTYSVNGRQFIVTVDGGHGSFGTKLGDYVRAYALP